MTDSDSGLPIAGVRVGFGGQSRPGSRATSPTRRTRSGRYTITNVPVVSYPKLAFFASAGYDPAAVRNVAIAANATTTHNIRHDA